MDRHFDEAWPLLYHTQSSAYFDHASIGDDPGPEHDYPMDAFDKQILSYRSDYRRPLAEQSYTKSSIPFSFKQRADLDHGRQDLRDDLLDVRQTPNSSSSPIFPVSSPTILALQNRTHTSQRTSQPAGSLPTQSSSSFRDPGTEAKVNHQTVPFSVPNPFNEPIPPAVLRGVPIIPTDQLPDDMRSIFSFDLFNIVQSKCFRTAFETDDNLIVAAPTGSGKTAIMELAICRLLATNKNRDFKVVYQAPTKSLCSERYRDWTSKFTTLGLQCGELTGDVEIAHFKTVQQAHVIITTPEKWDSVSRKWKDNAKLMQMIRLFLVDEVHILNETRGATLEAVVSRMKSAGSGVRFVALSATVPNSDDIAIWLGRNSTSQHLPAHREVFDESYRPVKLEKHVVGYKCSPNDFALDSILTKEIPKVIAQHAKKKPVMIFCVTKNSAMKSATSLAELWHSTPAHLRLWSGPRQQLNVTNTELQKTLSTGVAFHHGGLSAEDRKIVEEGFIRGEINIICSTSTLAVGINLPCYLVILKGTSCWGDGGLQEYSSLEVMQMLGRAGRPQYETSACAVILTHSTKTQRYEQMVSGQELLESSLHKNLIEHLNAEIGLGTIHDVQSAQKWLTGSFLSVRLRRNPTHYRLQDGKGHCDPDQLLGQICERDLKLLEDARLIDAQHGFQCTSYGDAMARYYVKYETMLAFLKLPKASRISDVLNILVQAHEFRDLKLRSGEKPVYKQLNSTNDIRYPIKGEIGLSAHKVSLLVQAQLGGVALEKADSKHTAQFRQDTMTVSNHCNRLIRCIIDMQIHNEDSVTVKHALELCRSLAAGVWDNTPMQLKQIESVGDVTARKLAAASINSIDTLLSTEPQQIELVLGRSQPFGSILLKKAASFPNLRVSVKEIKRAQKRQLQAVELQLQCEIGFMNSTLPVYFNRKAVYICFLCETSYGKLVEFRRFSASRLKNGEQIHFTALLDRRSDCIKCHVMCDEIAGTHRYAELKLDVPDAWFLSPEMSQETALTTIRLQPLSTDQSEKFDDADIADDDLLAAATGIEVFDMTQGYPKNSFTAQGINIGNSNALKRKAGTVAEDHTYHNSCTKGYREPIRLPNGNWTCQHNCVAEGRECKHLCCKEGVKKPKKRAKIQPSGDRSNANIEDTFTDWSVKKAPSARDNIRQIDDTLNKFEQSNQVMKVQVEQISGVAPSVSRLAQSKSMTDRQIFDIDDLISDDLPSANAIFQEANQHKPGSNTLLKSDNAVDVYDDLHGIDGMDFNFDDCDWNITDTAPIETGSVIAEQQQRHTSHDRPAQRAPTQCEPEMAKKLYDTDADAQSSTAPAFIATSVSKASGDDNMNFFDSADDFDSSILNQAGQSTISLEPNRTDISSTIISPPTVETVKHNNSGQAQVHPLTSPTVPQTEAERERMLHDEDQKKKWAQFPPWMYEMFGSCVDIVDE